MTVLKWPSTPKSEDAAKSSWFAGRMMGPRRCGAETGDDAKSLVHDAPNLAGQCFKRKRAIRQTKNKAKNVITQKASSATSLLGLVAASHMNTLSATILPMSTEANVSC